MGIEKLAVGRVGRRKSCFHSVFLAAAKVGRPGAAGDDDGPNTWSSDDDEAAGAEDDWCARYVTRLPGQRGPLQQ